MCDWITARTTLQGIWSGMIGGTLMQTLILVWVTFRTDWEKEVRAVTLHLRISYYSFLLFAHLSYTIALIILWISS
jgi:hypothetical protein